MKLKISIFILVLILIVFFFGKGLNIFSRTMFEFHDGTQSARIQQFTLNLKNLKIPPRLAPDMNLRMGYPVLNFYAPFSYWITSGINLLGFDVVNSLKISFLTCIILAFVFSFVFFRLFFAFIPSLIGAILYITSFYFPVDIFIRGNLAEVWFIALMPLSLYLLYKNSQKPKTSSFVLATIILAASFTSHNLLSMIFIPLTIIFTLLLKNKKINLLAIILALLLSSYFLLPLFLENRLTIAQKMAAQTNYQDHFLCLNQLWDSPWGYGGSIPGCHDGMTFKLGKIQIIFAVLGLISFFIHKFLKGKKPMLHASCFMFFVLIGSLFMTTNFSKFIWDLFSPFLAVFQFPWRFTTFSLIGLAFFSAYFWQVINVPYKSLVGFLIVLLIIGLSAKYFQGRTMAKNHFIDKYLSQDYIEKDAALRIPEYFSIQPQNKIEFDYKKPYQLAFYDSIDPKIAVKVDQKYKKVLYIPFPTQLWLNINYFPFWKITVNGKLLQPNIDFKLDSLNRPLINVDRPSIITVAYEQTLIEKFGNLLSLATFVLIFYLIKNKKLWKKLIN